MKKRITRKNPYAINEGNMRRWLYLVLPKYNRNLDLLDDEVEQQIFFRLEQDITGTFNKRLDPKLANLHGVFRNYLILFNDILKTDVLPEKEKLKIWRFYTLDFPEKMKLLRMYEWKVQPSFGNWFDVYTRRDIPELNIPAVHRIKREGKTRYSRRENPKKRRKNPLTPTQENIETWLCVNLPTIVENRIAFMKTLPTSSVFSDPTLQAGKRAILLHIVFLIQKDFGSTLSKDMIHNHLALYINKYISIRNSNVSEKEKKTLWNRYCIGKQK